MANVVDEMMMQFPTEFPELQMPSAELFGLNRIKIDNTPITALPMIEFNVNENVVWEWIANQEATYTAQNQAETDNMMQLYGDIMASLGEAETRAVDQAMEAFTADNNVTLDVINGIFNNVVVNDATLAEMFPEQYNAAISDALEGIRQSYEFFGIPVEETEEEINAQAEETRLGDERWEQEMEQWN